MAACVVVIDDEPEVLALMCDALEAGGFSVIGVSNPDLVQQVVATVDPHLFLVDLMLPGINGVALAERLRHQGFPRTPMIAVSASRMMIHQAAESGLFQEMVYKPFDISALVDCVRRCSTRKHA